MVELNYPFLVLVFAVVFVIVFLAYYKSDKKFIIVEIDGIKVNAEVADNFAKQATGLMFKEKLGKNDGMLFVFDEEDYHKFWMMNVKFPLDFIWISSNKTIVDVTENAQPCLINCTNFTSKKKAQYVLELNAVFVKENKIKIGNKVKGI